MAAPLEPLPISALQHHAYCPRQCALIHVEGAWSENVYTLRGARAHERADLPEGELLFGVRVERALPLWSERLGLSGRADVVEFGSDGTPYPVEYKSGPRRKAPRAGPSPGAPPLAGLADDLQLCAQAMCLEEMLGREVARGAVYHHASRRRREVEFTASLRAMVTEAVAAVRDVLAAERLPPPVADARCPDCSLIESCLPYAVRDFRRASLAHDPFALEEPT